MIWKGERWNWIYSGGGPLVLAEAHFVRRWIGSENPFLSSNASSDYDRACEARGYLERLSVQNTEVVVLSGEPMQTTFLNLPNSPLELIRWMWAPTEAVVAEALESTQGTGVQVQEPLEFQITSGDMMLFDSAASGDSVDLVSLRWKLPCGRYLIYTEDFENADLKVRLIRHRFRKDVVSIGKIR